ncbi:LHFPL tetraspan subfamily member 7 protein-like [Ostrea edulis]|uniref:LHFPL tetraspan subfamily member 7 protein-like n=1 Tax=Ostrea edulis TaxID=37623 RepID=UPI0024AEC415|nr:LHFPL tetraspan subfamily member 7 protein-like [Ostrea edulis]XP_056008102.1 LHFPL tetraspan subfamily member 7 protein-like [Ostrea edulis]XP_056008109.1 LHFPL tetraspan subfamily member 7 protein-like [Ostrea edulis]
MMVSFVFCLWVLLTVAIAVVWSVCLSQPSWVLHPDNLHSFGLQKYCVMATQENRDLHVNAMHKTCLPYGKELHLGNIPSGTWRAAFLLFSSGTFLFIASVFIGLLSLVIQGKWDRYVSTTTKYVQTTAVLVVMSALLTYPLGFGSPFFRYYCGAGAGPYDTGQCSVGWSFMLAIMGVSLSVFCPILWSFRWIKRDDFMDEMLV